MEIDRCLREHQERLREAYRAGEEAYGPLPLEFDRFARRIAAPLLDDGEFARALASLHVADAYLAIACDERVPGAWEVFDDRFVPRMRGMARRIGVSPEQAEEIARELSGELISPPTKGRTRTRLGSYDGRGSLFAWLSTTVRNRLTDRARRRLPSSGSEGVDEMSDETDPEPPLRVVGSETSDRLRVALRDALLDLSTRESLVLLWIYRDNQTQAQIAKVLKISVPRVSQLKKRAESRVAASVRRAIKDDSFSAWPSRDWIWDSLKRAVSDLLHSPLAPEPTEE